jgi:uncharacterized phage-associated protein
VFCLADWWSIMGAHLLNAHEVAQYFLSCSDERHEGVSNMKLQKLLYYSQGFHLAMHGCDPLFKESIEAWGHGPVVRPVYETYRPCGKSSIKVHDPIDPHDYPPEIREILDCVYRVYGGLTASRLRNMTHEEAPWVCTMRGQEISHQSLHDFFLTPVEAGRAGVAAPNGLFWPTRSFRHQERKAIMTNAPTRDRLRTVLSRVPSPDPWLSDSED